MYSYLVEHAKTRDSRRALEDWGEEGDVQVRTNTHRDMGVLA